MGDFFRLTSALHRDLAFYAFDAVGLASLRMNFGVDEAGANGVDADFFFGYFLGQTNRQNIDGAFRSCVVDVFIRRAEASSSG